MKVASLRVDSPAMDPEAMVTVNGVLLNVVVAVILVC